MTEKQIQEAMQVEGYELRTNDMGNVVLLNYLRDGRNLAQIEIVRHDRGIEWFGFLITEGAKGDGFFTTAHRFALEHQPSRISKQVPEAAFYKEAGYEAAEGDYLVLNEARARAWLDARS